MCTLPKLSSSCKAIDLASIIQLTEMFVDGNWLTTDSSSAFGIFDDCYKSG